MLAILARENITLDILLQPKTNTRATTCRAELSNDHRGCNRTNRTGSSNPQQSVEASMGIEMPKNRGGRCFVRRKTMALCDQKCFSLLYLSVETERRRLLTQKFPHYNIFDLSTLKIWEMMEIAFIRPRNIALDRYISSRGNRKEG